MANLKCVHVSPPVLQKSVLPPNQSQIQVIGSLPTKNLDFPSLILVVPQGSLPHATLTENNRQVRGKENQAVLSDQLMEAKSTEQPTQARKTDQQVEATNTELQVETTNPDQKVQATKTDQQVEATDSNQQIKATNTDQQVEATNLDQVPISHPGPAQTSSSAEVDKSHLCCSSCARRYFHVRHARYPLK